MFRDRGNIPNLPLTPIKSPGEGEKEGKAGGARAGGEGARVAQWRIGRWHGRRLESPPSSLCSRVVPSGVRWGGAAASLARSSSSWERMPSLAGPKAKDQRGFH